MKRKRHRNIQKTHAASRAALPKCLEISVKSAGWPEAHIPYLVVVGIALIALCTVIIYWQTVQVPPIDYDDPFYLVHSPYVRSITPFSSLGAVWNEPYFANFHPVTTTTWLLDRTLADKSKPFDVLPFRSTHLLYAVIGAALLIPLYHRLGISTTHAMLGALLFAVHPAHAEVVAWLSARKDLISLILIILSFIAWLWAVAAETPNQWRVRHALAIVLVLLAVLSKPVAVILPALFVAYEFCSGPHVGITRWRWAERHRQSLSTRTLVLAANVLVVGGFSTFVFRGLLAMNPMHGSWLIFVPMGLVLLTLPMAPSTKELEAFRNGSTVGIRVSAPPFLVLAAVSGAGSAWTFWAQQQVGAIKGGLTLLPTLNLTFEAMLAYVEKTLVPAYLSVSYTWSEYPNVSVRGLLGALLVCGLLWTAMRLAGSPDRNRRLIAFGIFWYLIAFVPVSNLVPTSTKMADRYLFVPTVGALLAVLALGALWCSVSQRRQFAVSAALVIVTIAYTKCSYQRTEVWCGKTTLWKDRLQPDLSLWTAAVETNPDDVFALTNLGLAYLRLIPPEAERALEPLNRALEIGQSNQSKIAGHRLLVLSPVYEALGDAYLTRASQFSEDKLGSDLWQQKKAAYANAVKYLGLASQSPSGFAPSDARVQSRLSEASEGQAQMDAQELVVSPPGQRDSLIRQRDEMRRKSEESMRTAREILTTGRVSALDPDYRMVMLGQGNIIFRRAGGATNEEKVGYYEHALLRYQEAAALLPADPRPFLYQGLCYERLTEITQAPEEKRRLFVLGEAAMRKAITLNIDSPDYSPALPYRGLASLYAHMNDFHSVLDALRKAKQADPLSAESTNIDREIQSVEQYLAAQAKNH